MTLFFDATLGTRVARALGIVQAPNLRCITLADRYRDTPTHGLEVPDETWIRDSVSEHWLALTQDRHLVERRHEREAIIESKAGIIILQPGDALNYDVLSFIIRRSEWLRRIDGEQRPFVYRVHMRGRPKKIRLEARAIS